MRADERAAPEAAPRLPGPGPEAGPVGRLASRLLEAAGGGLYVLAALALALAVGAAVLLLSGRSPVDAYSAMLEGMAGSRFAVGETLVRAAPLAIIGVGVSVALRAGLFTIGAEGQVMVGAVGAALAAFWLSQFPSWLIVPVGAVAGALFGAAWALPPALLRARSNVNEILSTLLFNYFAGFLVGYLLREPLRPEGSPISQSEVLPQASWLPLLLRGSRLHVGVVLAVAVALAFALWIRSVRGFRFDLFGQNPTLARHVGVSPTATVLSSMLVAGALAGIVGWVQVAGLHHRVYTLVASGTGYLGILVAILGGLRPLGVLAAALMLGALQAGGVFMQQTADVPATLSDVLQALVLLSFAARLSPGLRRAVRRRREEEVAALGERMAREEPAAGAATAQTTGREDRGK